MKFWVFLENLSDNLAIKIWDIFYPLARAFYHHTFAPGHHTSLLVISGTAFDGFTNYKVLCCALLLQSRRWRCKHWFCWQSKISPFQLRCRCCQWSKIWSHERDCTLRFPPYLIRAQSSNQTSSNSSYFFAFDVIHLESIYPLTSGLSLLDLQVLRTDPERPTIQEHRANAARPRVETLRFRSANVRATDRN